MCYCNIYSPLVEKADKSVTVTFTHLLLKRLMSFTVTFTGCFTV